MEDRRVPPLTRGVLTLFGLGYLPGGATLASAAAVATWALLRHAGSPLLVSGVLFVALLALATATLWVGDVGDDPKEVVVDEFLGMYLALMFVSAPDLRAIATLFVAFRVLDILKVPPFSWIDRWKARVAILLDDVAIGLCLGLAYTAYTRIARWAGM